ncbi:Ig-like domain-containing protein [Xanthocytophaga flava]|uniref:Ig-like domain-containing protein n=1 Tax=Xanthocytophaga flava TaxID=3048013 RepID=UPI0028D2F437|nr:gliding motility-associated C-terminal domain-containing protein [Xanthocytophaga flavus]MDJ1470440.1 gliding motility-associated C-terminal domain-containing protein [Xanthocytophaga flavus]
MIIQLNYSDNKTTLHVSTAMVLACKKIPRYLRSVSLLCILFISSISIINAQCPDFTIPSPLCAGGNCAGGTLITPGLDTAGISGYIWYVTPPSGDKDTLYSKDLVYSFGVAGLYKISLSVIRGTDTLRCSEKDANAVEGVAEFSIKPDNNLGEQDEEICKGSSITFSAGFDSGGSLPNGAKYLWSTGDSTATITVDSAGCYSVTITDPATGCSRTNKVNLKLYKPTPDDPQKKKEISRWYFGNGSGVIFYNISDPEATSGSINTPEGTSAVSDASGKFLFYTDGRNVYDKTGAPMTDLGGNDVIANNGLHGGENSTQATLIVAQPGCSDCDPVYYVFTTSDISSTGSLLEYSIVDMRRNGGLGQVTKKNVRLFNSSTERLASIKSTDTSSTAVATTWIVTHDFNTSTFRVYPLTASGLGSPKTYNVGNVNGPNTENGEGYMKVYEDKVVIVIPGANGEENIVQVFPFDSSTGEVKAPPITLTLGIAPPKAYGVEIVGDSTLYVSLAGSGLDSSRIVGFNLGSGVDSLVQKTMRSIYATTSFTIGALQLDPTGQRLYVAQEGQTSLGEITGPTTLKSAGYTTSSITLTSTSGLGLPNTGPPQNDGTTEQSFSISSIPCTLENTPVVISFQAHPDRAGGDVTKSSYAWTFTTKDGSTLIQTIPDMGFGKNDSVSVTFPGPGQYKAALTITNDCLSEVIDPQDFTIPLQPPPTNMRDTSVCAGTVVRLDPYRNVPGPSGTVTYTWITPAKDTIPGTAGVATFDATLPGVYTVIVSTGLCSVTDSMRVSYSSIDVNLGNDTLLCSQSTLVLNAGNPGAKYEWYQLGDPQVKSTTQTYSVTPTTNVSYLVKVTDAVTGCTDSDTISIAVKKSPNVKVTTTPSSSCSSGNGIAEVTIIDKDPAATYLYSWSRSDMSPLTPFSVEKVEGLNPGIYYVRVAGSTMCDTTIVFSIENSSADAPQFMSNAPVQLTCDQTTGTLELTPSTSNITSYQLATTDGFVVRSGGALTGMLTISGLSPGSYLLTGNYGGSGCTFSFTYEVKAAPGKPQVQGVGTVTDCQTAQLSATGILTNVSFQWNRLDGTAITTSADGTATVTQSGTYILSATGSTSCVAKDTVVITLGLPGTASIANYTPVCEGSSVVLTANTSPAFDSYTWVRPDGTSVAGTQITATIPGEYKLRARNTATNCADSVLTKPFFDPTVPPTSIAPITVCAGTSIQDPAELTGSVRWYADAAKTQFLSDLLTYLSTLKTNTPGTTTYHVSQLSKDGCESSTTPVTVIIIEGPTVNLGNDTTVCAGNPVVLNATVSGTGVTYKWSTGATTPTITVSSAGTYSVEVKSGSCTISDDIKITYLPGPVVNVVSRQVALCMDNSTIDSVALDAGPGINYTYVWTLAGSAVVLGTEQKLTVSQLGTYVVTVNNGSACPGRDTIRVVNICDPILKLPDAFTPNSDGHNDVLEVFSKHVGSFKIMIFNRWGEVVYAFETTNLYEAVINDAFPLWNGKYRGQDAPTGTYSWRAVYTSRYYPEGTPVERRGGILLIR